MTGRRYLRDRATRPTEPTVKELQARWRRMGAHAKQERQEIDLMPDGLDRLRRSVALYAYLISREDIAMLIDAKLARYGRTR
jgi:hypothetical protein